MSLRFPQIFPMKKTHIAEFFARLAAIEPKPETELTYTSRFTLLVAVVLSAQATDKSVNKATPALFKKAGTPAKMAALGAKGIEKYIRTIGLYRNKAKHVAALSQRLLDDHKGRVPKDLDALTALPGVGRKTANVVLNVGFGIPTFAVDTHVFRLANRTGLAAGKTARAVEDALDACVPDPYRVHAHHWLILHGRYICTARAPRCADCVVRDLCGWPEKTAG